jgi:hypothetical protein
VNRESLVRICYSRYNKEPGGIKMEQITIQSILIYRLMSKGIYQGQSGKNLHHLEEDELQKLIAKNEEKEKCFS